MTHFPGPYTAPHLDHIRLSQPTLSSHPYLPEPVTSPTDPWPHNAPGPRPSPVYVIPDHSPYDEEPPYASERYTRNPQSDHHTNLEQISEESNASGGGSNLHRVPASLHIPRQAGETESIRRPWIVMNPSPESPCSTLDGSKDCQVE